MPKDKWDNESAPDLDNSMIDPAWWFRAKRDRDDEDQPASEEDERYDADL